jgi:hypothetical protein
MLQIWGLRATGGSLKSPIKRSTGGEAQQDDELAVALYVQSTPGFATARPVLRRIYCEGRTANGDWWRGPGESLGRAALRLGWGRYLGIVAMKEIPMEVHADFMHGLEQRLIDSPFRLPERTERLCPVEQAEQLASLINAAQALSTPKW